MAIFSFSRIYDMFHQLGDTMAKIKMMLLVHQIEGMLKETIRRKSDFLEVKKILDSIRDKIFEERL